MKHFGRYLSLFLVIIISIAWLKSRVANPERLIIGTWNERSWRYERVNSAAGLAKINDRDSMAQSVKDILGKHLVIHSAETWEFKPDGSLLLVGVDTVKQVKWKLKGRGNILELEYADKVIEHYNLSELTSEKMALNFDSDMQVKGIARLTFDNIKYVTKVQ